MAPKPDRLAERLSKRAAHLTPTHRVVADYIAKHRQSAMTMSATELGAAIGTSDATVIRAVQALGFNGLRELKQELAAATGHGVTPADNMMRTLATVEGAEAAVDQVLNAHMEAIARLSGARKQINDAIVELSAAPRIGVYGIGPSAAIASYAHTLLGRMGKPGILLQTTGSGLADHLLDLANVNALLVLAYGEAYPEVEATIAEARRLKLPIVLITDSLEERLARQAKVTVAVARGRAGNVALHGATLVCLEAILLGVAAKDPAGALAALQRLNDLRQVVRSRRKG